MDYDGRFIMQKTVDWSLLNDGMTIPVSACALLKAWDESILTHGAGKDIKVYAGEETRARNQRIQNMFRMIGFGENLGSGFPLILSAWNEKHWLKPELIEQRELMQVKLVLSIETKDATANETVNETVNATVKLSKTQKKILPIIQKNKYATYEEIAKQLDIARATVGRNLDTMKKNGVINRVGGDKNGYWEILLDIKKLDK